MLLKKGKVTVIHLILLCILLVASVSSGYAQNSQQLGVYVLEKETELPIPGAIVKDKKQTFVADSAGYCRIPYDGAGKITLSVRSLGYNTLTAKTFSVKGSQLTIYLHSTAKMLDGITVSGQQRHSSVLQQASVIDAKTLAKNSSLSLSQLLEKVPGVSSISSGNSIGKPVIQGMHSSRILLVNNGVRLESQNWGIDHAPEIDHTASSIVEVIKGAESIRYGYGAVGGVVLFNQAKLPYGNDRLKVNGNVNSGYSTNSRSYDFSSTIEMGYKKVGLRLHSKYQRAGDYATADYLLNNTGYKNISFSALAGYQGHKLTVTLGGSLYYSRCGLYYGSKLSDIDQLLTRFQIGRPEENTIRPFSYDIAPPFQQSQHVTIKSDINWDISKQHNLLFRLSFQKNLREEFENRKKEKFSWLPVQDLKLTTYNAEAIWSGNWTQRMTSQAGLAYMYQTNYNIPGTRQPAFIPNFTALTTGIFLLHKMTFGKLVCSAGMRYDIRGLDVNGYTSLSSFQYYSAFKVYSNFTGNVAAHYSFSNNLEARVNLGWAWRPPDINELYASGLHHGTYWVVGNNELTSERGYKAVVGGRYRTERISVEPSLFYQQVTNYIYDNIGMGANRFHNHPSGKYPKFIYGQDNVRLVGGDLTATVMPYKDLKISGKGEWIYARNISQDNWLPFMPSDRYGLACEYQFGLGRKSKWLFNASLDGTYVTQQKRFDPIKDLVPETPPAYFLLGGSLEAGTELKNKHSLRVILLGSNMLNSLYKEYTDRFRYYAHERGSQFTIKTIYNF